MASSAAASGNQRRIRLGAARIDSCLILAGKNILITYSGACLLRRRGRGSRNQVISEGGACGQVKQDLLEGPGLTLLSDSPVKPFQPVTGGRR